MAAATAGTTHILSAGGIALFTRLYWNEREKQFPVQAAFGVPKPVDSSRVVVTLLELIRSVGSFDSKPTPAQEVALERYSQLVVNALYQHKRFELPPGAVNSMRRISAMADPAQAGEMMADLESELQEGIATRLWFMARTFEDACIQILTSTTPAFTVDGVTQTLSGNPFNLHKVTESTSWKVAATDVLSLWEARYTEFKKRAGGPASTVYVGPDFYKDVIVGNDDVRDFLMRNPEFITRKLATAHGLNLAQRDADATFRVVEVPAQKTDADGDNAANMWPDDTITIVGENSPVPPLRNITVRTPDNNHQGGAWAYFDKRADPIQSIAIATHNGIPVIADHTQVMTIDYTP